ncbi:dihydrodipicolinate synthase family protein [Pseudothermotoga elfii]|jgi:N-acetylneuraminate lyase/4-hydroxy-tetrahydrodipicolinate synthase
MVEQKLFGVIPPLLTLFNRDGSVDYKATCKLAEFLSKYVHGLFVCGTYGGGPLMTEPERMKLVEKLTETLQNKVPLVVHIGTTNTPEAIRLAKHAEKCGAIAVASVPPYYYHYSNQQVLKHFTEIVDSVSIPVYVYNNPKTVGYGISSELLKNLEAVGVKGVKDSSFDILVLEDYKRTCSKNFDVVLGTEAMFMIAHFLLDIQAFIPGLANAFPEIVRQFFDACMANEVAQAKLMHEKILKLRKIAYQAGSSNMGVLALLHIRGFKSGYPRLPFEPVSEDLFEKMRAQVSEVFCGDIPAIEDMTKM